MQPNPKRAQIEKIRLGFGFDAHGRVVNPRALKTLENCLRVISDQLNQEVSHFLLEFIQNADDLNYDTSVEPILSFEILENRLIISSNERGFSERDVDAICSVGESTKVNNNDTTGEKGIGFKSVFKCCDEVTVSSNGFHFGFDRKRHCGIVVPEWEEIPPRFRCSHHDGKTVFLIDFSTPQLASLVVRDLRALQPTVLLFLRQLRKIEIIDLSKRVITKDNFGIDGLSTISLNTTLDGKPLTAWGAGQDWRYFQQTIPTNVQDEKRQGHSNTNVALAFPVSSEPPRGQAVNILPICTTAFPFLIQADFILSASREGLDQKHQEWNDALMRGLSEAFVEAVKVFNEVPELRHIWLRYLPTKEDLTPFSQLSSLIRVGLKMSPVLLSADLAPEIPSKLCYVPENWRDNNNRPLFRASKTTLPNLSTDYSSALLPCLQWLGVNVLDPKAILNGFRQYLAEDGGREFQAQPVTWHSRLADALFQFNASQLDTLCIVPVQDGEWAAPRSQTIMFPQCQLKEGVVEIPPGLPTLLVVRKAFAEDQLQSLQNLYLKIGVKPGTLEETCHAIKQAHSGNTPPSDDPSVLMLHAFYLFRGWMESGGRPVTTKTDFWICNLDGYPLKGQVMYQDESVVSEMARHYIKGTTSEQNLMHPYYLSGIDSAEKVQWTKWLSTALGVLKDIRISDNGKDCFSPEFSVCQRKNGSAGLLKVLSDTWRENFGSQSPPTKVCAMLKSMKKNWTSDGTEMELQDTFLPREQVMERAPHGVPLLRVANPEDPSWDFLEQLGVIVDDNIELWFSSIRHFMKGGASAGSMFRIYQSISQYQSSSGQKIRNFFSTQAAIFVPTKGSWVRPRDCLWKSNVAFRRKCVLSMEYSWDLEIFFKAALGIEDVKVEDMIAELRLWTFETDLQYEYVRSLLLALSTTFRESRERYKIDKDMRKLNVLRNSRIMPIVKYADGKPTRKTVALNDATYQWYFVDTNRHQESFMEMVWLADFALEKSLRLKTLMDYMREVFHNDKPMLSTKVTEASDYRGTPEPCVELTASARGRSGYIGCIARRLKKPPQDLDHRIRMLNNCTVNSVFSISTRMTLSLQSPPGATIIGTPREKDQVTLKETFNSLVVYITQKAAGTSHFPAATADQLCNYLGVEIDKFKLLIHQTLNADDGEQARDILVAAGIDIDQEADEMLEANKVNAHFVAPSSERSHNGHAEKKAQGPRLPRNPIHTTGQATIPARTQTTLPARNKHIAAALPSVLTPDQQGALRKSQVTLTKASRASAGFSEDTQDWWDANPQSTQFDGHGHPPSSSGNSEEFATTLPRGAPRRRHDNRYDPTAPTKFDPQTGSEGEFTVYNLLKEVLGDNFGPDNWTSEMREYAGREFTRWTPPDPDTFYADFTYEDKDSKLADYLYEQGVISEDVLPAQECKFHIEVKSTRTGGEKGKKEGFEMSEWQWNECMKMSLAKWDGEGEKKDVFLVFRVSGVGSDEPSVDVMADPWKEVVEGTMHVRVPGGVVVCP